MQYFGDKRDWFFKSSIGAWLGSVRESLYGTEPASSFTTNRDVLLIRLRFNHLPPTPPFPEKRLDEYEAVDVEVK